MREAANYENPIPSREYLSSFMLEAKHPMRYEELAEKLGLLGNEDGEEALYRRLKAMVRDGQLERLKGGYFWPLGERNLVQGKVLIDKSGSRWVMPEDGSGRILLQHDLPAPVYSGNKVIASVPSHHEGKYREGRLVEIVDQPVMTITGRFIGEKDNFYVLPHGKEVAQDIQIPHDKTLDAKEGDIVVVTLKSQTSASHLTLGEVIEVLGHEDKPGIEIIAAIHAYQLPEIWPSEVKKEIAGLKASEAPTTTPGRTDLRALPLVTIDGEDAKDFDDAVYCQPNSGGGWQLYVAIADVSHYVRPKSALDIEAKSRGNSVYFPGKVIPMLPEVLSNELCSLKPEVDRLCMVCEMTIDATGEMTHFKFYEAIMCSKARLTYTKVAALLQDGSDMLREQYQAVLPDVKNLHELYKILRVQREARGAIEFETVETRIIFGKNGKISRIEPVVRNEAHRIIEECMLCANVAAAKFLKQHKSPALYRIHEGPPLDKLTDLRSFLSELGIGLEGGKSPTPLDYAKLLRSISHRSDAHLIQTVLLRSLSQAVYSPDNVGHFGLAYGAYAHFTSPIRRYPDLLVHRQIRAVISGQHKPDHDENSEEGIERKAAIQAQWKLVGEHCSMTERRADDATRDAVRWLKCEYIAKHVGDAFEGIISGVTRFGFFVELKDLYIDGLVHVNSLRDDFYNFDPSHHQLVGERAGSVYKLGDTLQVKVSKVDIDQRKIDFDLILDPNKIKNSGSKKQGEKKANPEKPKRKRKGK